MRRQNWQRTEGEPDREEGIKDMIQQVKESQAGTKGWLWFSRWQGSEGEGRFKWQPGRKDLTRPLMDGVEHWRIDGRRVKEEAQCQRERRHGYSTVMGFIPETIYGGQKWIFKGNIWTKKKKKRKKSLIIIIRYVTVKRSFSFKTTS